jgi:hypothetical protein
MGCKVEMGIKRILIILLVITMITFATFAPVSKIVYAGTTDTITITFDPDGNSSIDISPNSYAFGSVWANASAQTNNNYFTIWNNGSGGDMVADAQVTTDAANLNNAIDATGTQTDDTYSLRIRRGAVSNSTYISEHYYAQVDSQLSKGSPENFGFRLTISNITSNITSQTVVVTFRGT